MSKLSFMEKLLCGEEVEWKSLEDVAFFANGKGHEKAITENGNYVVVNSKFISTDGKVAKYSDEQLCPLSVDDILIVMSDLPNGRALAKTFIVDENDKYTLNQRIGAISVQNKKVLLPKFLNYFLNRSPYLTKYDNGVDQTNLKKGQILDVKIPIPCPDNHKKSLEIQVEIVRILDAFTAMTAELTAELSLRKKQYNHYRDQLLSFEEGEVEWKMLGEIAEFRRGTAITKKQTIEGDIPVVANGPLPTYYHGESNRDGEIIVIARSGAYAGYVSFWNQPIFLTDAFSVHPNADMLKPKYVYYFLQNKQDHIHGMKKGAGVPHVRVKEFESYNIPVPSLEEQNRIVTILDKFDTLTSSITEGLPREIELRQKQYEYYRDLLLSFPKPETKVMAGA